VPTAEERFWAKVHRQPEGCWRWTGAKNQGYGAFHATPNRTIPAHRYAYELLRGPIPPGLTIDHLCRVRDCVNPDHMEPVSRGENVLRGESLPAQNKRRDCCKNGHLLTGTNVKIEISHDRTSRRCLVCRRARDRERNGRKAKRRSEAKRLSRQKATTGTKGG